MSLLQCLDVDAKGFSLEPYMDNINRWGMTYKMHRPYTTCDTLLSIVGLHCYRMSDITQVEQMLRSQYYSQHQIIHILKGYK